MIATEEIAIKVEDKDDKTPVINNIINIATLIL
jgi:hypothetical protein